MKSRDRVYDAIVKYMKQNQFSPSIRELCDMTGLKSTSSVHAHLMTLESEGRIQFFGVRQIKVNGYEFRES